MSIRPSRIPEARAGGRILVIDDERAIARAIAMRLAGEGRDASCAFSAHEGLCLARSGAYDAVVLDLCLPDLDGFAVLGQLRGDAATRALPVVVVSASLSDEARARARVAGASAAFPKPFDWRELSAAIDDSIAGNRAGTGGGA